MNLARTRIADSDRRAAERDAKLQAIRRMWERWNAPSQVGPPPPHDMK